MDPLRLGDVGEVVLKRYAPGDVIVFPRPMRWTHELGVLVDGARRPEDGALEQRPQLALVVAADRDASSYQHILALDSSGISWTQKHDLPLV